MASKSGKINYKDGLERSVLERYMATLSLIGGIDPYEIDKGKLTSNVQCLTEITYIDILNYLVNTKSAYTLDDLKCYKSLESYNQFVNGWVKDVLAVELNNNVLVIAKVRHSQRMNDTPLKPWIIAQKTGIVEAAHCDCMAGLGEACSHVGALLFYIETAVRIENAKTETQKKAYRLLPSSIDKVGYAEVSNIDFTSAETKKKQLDNVICGATQHKEKKKQNLYLPDVPAPTDTEFDDFTLKLFATKTKPVVLAIMPKYAEHFIPQIISTDLPKLFFELGDDQCLLMHKNDIVKHCEDMFRDINVTAEQAKHAERLTRGQSECKDWHRLRTGRITASRMKAVCTSSIDKPSISTIRNICYPVKFSNKATRWGCQHEKDAVDAYITKLAPRHDNLSVVECGFIINPEFPHIGASPDALVSCNCCGEGTVEVKCPYCVRDTHFHNDNIAYLDKDNKLKTCHQYYYQVQTQIFLCKKKFCDFVVWTQKDISVERILPNPELWQEIEVKSRKFFIHVILPELTGKFFTRPQSENIPPIASVLQPSITNNDGLTVSGNTTDLICFCQVPYDENFDDVVGCDNHNCRLKWLHFRCINMSRAPKGSYYCPECSPVHGSKVKKPKMF